MAQAPRTLLLALRAAARARRLLRRPPHEHVRRALGRAARNAVQLLARICLSRAEGALVPFFFSFLLCQYFNPIPHFPVFHSHRLTRRESYTNSEWCLARQSSGGALAGAGVS